MGARRSTATRRWYNGEAWTVQQCPCQGHRKPSSWLKLQLDLLASFCRETPGFMLACVSSPIKLGTTDDRCRVSPSVLTRFLSRFHELPVGRHVVVMTCGGLFHERRIGRVRRLFVCAMIGPPTGLQSS